MRAPFAACLVVALALAGCGGGGGSDDDTPSPAEQAEQGQPVLGQSGDEEPAGPALGFPVFATKNTTRVGGADPVANAAGVAQAVFPSRSEDTRPPAVVLVDQDDWRAGISAAQLMAGPVRSPVLLTEGDELPEATADALEKLQPTGSKEAGDAEVIRIGDVAEPDDLKSTDVAGDSPAATARAIDRLASAAAERPSTQRRGRVGGPAGLRDARRRLGREVGRPGAVDRPRRASTGDARGDPGAQAPADLRARARRT